MAGPSTALSPVIAASTHWLARAYPGGESNTVAHTLSELQARQAVTVAAWLRYPTEIDAALVAIAGPGGSAVLDWKAGSEPDDEFAEGEGWRTWVDEVVVSWAACLLADPMLARRGVDAVIAAVPIPEPRPRPHTRRAGGLPSEFRRLLQPDVRDREAATLLRHPDLLEPIAAMHRDTLLYLLDAEQSREPLAA
ncbi:hypothetical protein GCM10010168_82090 [Actinoplanes ianthinogenes]|uniref:Uncharacterized protein n=1 Tax=Actinoplanes ianthinogenes TaxID=122358 RepID=A0ABN6C5I4_9ACTN|nr:hypothetical protein [Actinoplanes ianthinogenes]BCJ40457.1 hypothetical protein Aiant_11140 [Actinoplanes ianthinogenes]GGR50749.1 hypothetical protein GCM10010168_82090 [Actinoplanes ianthinogenes]